MTCESSTCGTWAWTSAPTTTRLFRSRLSAWSVAPLDTLVLLLGRSPDVYALHQPQFQRTLWRFQLRFSLSWPRGSSCSWPAHAAASVLCSRIERLHYLQQHRL